MKSPAIVASTALLVVLFLAALAVQVIILPRQAAAMAWEYPEFTYLQFPILVLAIAIIACGQLILACIWTLLTKVRRDRIFGRSALLWVDIMIGALLLAVAFSVAIFVTLVYGAEIGPPGVIYGLLLLVCGCLALALVLLVMRGLLRKATEQASYLDEVV